MLQRNALYNNFPLPLKGISSTSRNDPSYAKFIKNLLCEKGNVLKLRNGTTLVNTMKVVDFKFNNQQIVSREEDIGDVIYSTSYINNNGISDIILYVTYFIGIDVTISIEVDRTNKILQFTISNIANSSYIYKLVNNPRFKIIVDGTRYIVIADHVMYNKERDFLILQFLNWNVNIENQESLTEVYLEEAGIFIYRNNAFTMIISGLLASCMPNSVLLDNKLLIYNGLDNNLVWDGQKLNTHVHELSIPKLGEIIRNNNTFTTIISKEYYDELINCVTCTRGKALIEINSVLEYESTISNIQTEDIDPIDGTLVKKITATFDTGTMQLQDNDKITNIFYNKIVPAITIASIVHRRLFFVCAGVIQKNWSTKPKDCLIVYFADVIGKLNKLVNESRIINNINLSSVLDSHDDIIKIEQLNNETIFFCRRNIIVYSGNDPTTYKNEQEIYEPRNFFLRKIIKNTGVIHINLIHSFSDHILFLSDTLELLQLSVVNQTLQMEVIKAPDSINYQLAKSFEYIKNNYEYRKIISFYSSYNKLYGIKINSNTFVSNTSNKTWTIFTENFSSVNNFCYLPDKKELLLFLPKAIMLVYADKINNLSYEEEFNGNINWEIKTGWLQYDNTWHNNKINFVCRTLEPTNVSIQLMKDYNTSIQDVKTILKINQIGAIFDESKEGIDYFTNSKNNYAIFPFKFIADSIFLTFEGSTKKEFIIYDVDFIGKFNIGNIGDNNANN